MFVFLHSVTVCQGKPVFNLKPIVDPPPIITQDSKKDNADKNVAVNIKG